MHLGRQTLLVAAVWAGSRRGTTPSGTRPPSSWFGMITSRFGRRSDSLGLGAATPLITGADAPTFNDEGAGSMFEITPGAGTRILSRFTTCASVSSSSFIACWYRGSLYA